MVEVVDSCGLPVEVGNANAVGIAQLGELVGVVGDIVLGLLGLVGGGEFESVVVLGVLEEVLQHDLLIVLYDPVVYLDEGGEESEVLQVGDFLGDGSVIDEHLY